LRWNPGSSSGRFFIKVNDEILYIGSFEKEIDAAKAYNEAVDKHFGNSEFHYRNIL